MSTVVISDGFGTGNQSSVSDDGKLSTESTPTTATPTRVESTVGTTSAALLNVTDAVGIQIQNTDPSNTLYIRFGTSSATTNDWALPPGGEYHLPSTVRYTGEVQVVASAASTTVLAIAWEL